MSIPELIAAHNELAPPRDVPPLKTWKDSRVNLATRVAILRTRKVVAAVAPPPEPKKRKRRRRAGVKKRRGTPIRSAILRGLAVVSHFERIKDGSRVSKHAAWRYPRASLLSVGLPYPDILARIRREHPDSKVSRNDLRWTATKVRDRMAGFENCALPQKRPHGGKKGK